MPTNNRALSRNQDVLHRMRAPYPAALGIKRYLYRDWAIDVVTYDEASYVSYVWGTHVEGKRFGPFVNVAQALNETKAEVDLLIHLATAVPVEQPKVRGTKRPKRKKAKA